MEALIGIKSENIERVENAVEVGAGIEQATVRKVENIWNLITYAVNYHKYF